ncbi:MAG: hypothetical protein VB118_08855 [Oscillospiraceae bacterium]|nr:hypothetical protein [Oscillospiraceae bacterium]
MENQIFRKKSMDRVSSPEQLNDYVRVSNPSVWMILAAVIILLAGVCIWGIYGRLDTKLTAAAIAQDRNVTVYIKESDMTSLTEGQIIRINDQEYTFTALPSSPVSVNSDFESYALHIGDLQIGEWVYEASFSTALPDGIYKAEIIIDSVSPISFIMN